MEDREYTKVIDYVKAMILDGQLNLGDKLPTEREMAETLKLGRYSVREALRIMENMGLIESRQGSGNYLSSNICKNLTQSLSMLLLVKQVDFQEISQLRRAIELHAYRLAIDTVGKYHIDEMKNTLAKMKGATSKKEAELDRTFHYLIIKASENKLMISIMEALSQLCEDFIEQVLKQSTAEMKEKFAQSHFKMLEGLETKNSDIGYRAINAHYDLIDSMCNQL
jgi:GntR family transcriptional repressor for pyruvate dehydrogenase complex